MTKYSKVILIVIIFMLLCMNINGVSFAATGSVTLTPSVTDVKSGDTFTVSISGECEDGIIGIESILDYDPNIFELKSTNVSSNWSSLGEGTKLDAMTSSDVKTGDIFLLTFVVKDNINVTSSSIGLKNIKFYKTYNQILDVTDKSISINIKEDETPVSLSKIEVTSKPSKTEYIVGETFSTNGLVITATYSDGTTKPVTNYTYTPNTVLTTGNTIVTFRYNENGVTTTATQAITVKNATSQNNASNTNNDNNNTNNTSKTNTTNITNTNNSKNNTVNNTNTSKTNTTNTTNTSNTISTSSLPKTGSKSTIVVIAIASFIVVAIISYIGYERYKGL